MAPRLQLERAAWRWVESVRPEDVNDEHIETAYRIRVPACKRGACRNCKGNPNCLVGIGEHVWLGEIDENAFHNIDDPNSERRDKNTFVGLTNLGATCYANTFLQVWFHNLELRQTLYLCQNSRAEEHNLDSDYEPQTICEHLQYLFALLQNSNRRYIDPSGLVKALGLDTGQQQDAQEFSKLFLSLLEDTLSKQKNPNLHNVIQQQFCGQFAYVTVCNQCGRASSLPSRFYEMELNIQGHKQLTDCVTEFLKEEKLEGDNRYFCESCQSKQNATRRITLQSLPRTLNLQLMRFVFDRQTGHKKKLNTFISFPEVLDMGPYLEQKEEKCVYELNAVLIHRGVSAYSGHYIAHVRDARTSDWYKFNDEEIEKMEGKKLQLGIEEDIAETVKSQTRKPKCSKGYHCSRNAYMLVYKRQMEDLGTETEVNIEVPAFLQRLVEGDNRKFEEWCVEMAEMRKQSVDKGKAKHEEVKELYELLPAEDGQPFEFVPLEWLKKWLDDSTVTKSIDNAKFLCSHGKLHPDKIADVKRISVRAAELFFDRYGGSPRLDRSSLCQDCVVQRCRVLRLKNQLNEDYKEVSNFVKMPLKSNEGYWIGKASLRSWRQLALEQLEEEEEETKHTNGKANGDELDISAAKGEPDSDAPEVKEEGDEEEMKTFNEDILCPHGGLSILESERKLISVEVWSRLAVYFPKAPEFSHHQEPCQQCLVREQRHPHSQASSSTHRTVRPHVVSLCQRPALRLDREGKETEALNKMMANEQKTSLLNLFQEKNRPTLQKWPQVLQHSLEPQSSQNQYDSTAWNHSHHRTNITAQPGTTETDVLYIVSLFFVEEWKKFIRRPAKSTPVSNVGNSVLLCPHGGFMFTYDSMVKGDAQHIALLWPSEWDVISRLFLVDQPISICRISEQTPDGAVNVEYRTQPELCQDCREGLIFQQQRDMREYAQATVYIRKVVDNKKIIKEAAPEFNVSGSEAEDEREENKGDGENDPDFNQSEDGAKRQKLCESSGCPSASPSTNASAAAAAAIAAHKAGIRRSTRHRKLRGEKALIVSANQTLKELKIQIMHAFSVAPFDQNLSIDGRCLTDDSATLGSLGVIPESVICLKADEPIADYAAMDDVYQVCMPEEGFKGTGLLGH
ncbi:ubiquitin carboxyl-terminal hydrolase 48 isoform X2 [Anguilla rostrata]|uniref:ubiquitin carboxyl-terminal hydrolase 48 isoform X2 n=1 Tax=Anguilla rostrata TaxID=7938 RepID=UPI0030D33971